MHLKALHVLLTLLCVHAFGALAAPVHTPPPPEHHEHEHTTTPAHHPPAINHNEWQAHGSFHPQMGLDVKPAHEQHEHNLASHKSALHEYAATHPNPRHEPGPSRPATPAHPEGYLGHGRTGAVFKLPRQVRDEHGEAHDAVIKVMHDPHGMIHPDEVNKEVENLKHVNQYLGHGYHEPTKTHYIVQKNMGGAAQPGTTEEEKKAMHEEATKRYRDQFHMSQNDIGNQNYVYHTKNGKQQAEIIDWADATHHAPPSPVQEGSSSGWGGLKKLWG